jgi:hypothetical protein
MAKDNQTPAPTADTSAPAREQLLQENAELKAKLAALQAEKEANAELEKKIQAKTARGLSREQARAVIERQEAFDQAQPTLKTPKPGKLQPAETH